MVKAKKGKKARSGENLGVFFIPQSHIGPLTGKGKGSLHFLLAAFLPAAAQKCLVSSYGDRRFGTNSCFLKIRRDVRSLVCICIWVSRTYFLALSAEMDLKRGHTAEWASSAQILVSNSFSAPEKNQDSLEKCTIPEPGQGSYETKPELLFVAKSKEVSKGPGGFVRRT